MSVPQLDLPLAPTGTAAAQPSQAPAAIPPTPPMRAPSTAARGKLHRLGEARAIHVSGFDRVGQDFYATPSWVTEALLRHVHFRGPIWEPCCGDGAMSRSLHAAGYDVVSTDIVDRGFGTAGVDFLTCHAVPGGCRSLVTNPPYGDSGSHAAQSRSSTAMLGFLRQALLLTASVQGQLALLVRLQWIAGRRASAMASAAPFAAVVVLTQRICWFDRGQDTKAAQHHHAWVVFDHTHPPNQPPAMHFA